MLSNYSLTFQSGSIITGELLDTMFSQPNNTLMRLFDDYSDGVISGLMPFHSADNKLLISKGIYRYNDTLYIQSVEKEIKLDDDKMFEPNRKYYTYISSSHQTISNNIVLNNIDFKTVLENDLPQGAEVLFSFLGKPELPKFSADLLMAKFDMLSFKKASHGREATFSPYVFNIIYNYLIDLSIKGEKVFHPLDYIIINSMSSNGFIGIEMIKKYISASGIKITEKCNNRKDIMRLFLDAIKKLNGSTPIPVSKGGADVSTGSDSIWF